MGSFEESFPESQNARGHRGSRLARSDVQDEGWEPGLGAAADPRAECGAGEGGGRKLGPDDIAHRLGQEGERPPPPPGPG